MCLVENKQQSDDLNDEKSFIRLIFLIFILLQQALSQMYLKRKKKTCPSMIVARWVIE